MIPRIYVLDDDRVSATMVSSVLDGHGNFQTEVFYEPQKLLDRCAEQLPDAVVTDLQMPEIDGIEVTRRLRQVDPIIPVFVLTGQGALSTAIEALKAGANEYLMKPANTDELITLLERALGERPMKEEARSITAARQQEFSLNAILGKHKKVEEVREFVRQIAEIPRPTVLLLGESGTGKNLVARSLHYSSPHAQGRFVEINCSALPGQLLEAELFGYNKGAFTDARQAKRGLIEEANGGTLFLDELGEMPIELQAKLLQFLESREFRRLGSTDEIKADVRLVTATNRNLQDAVREGAFRADLYYRIVVASHTLPPLRDIKSDIPQIADHFRQVFRREFRKDVESIAPDAITTLKNWRWPGNVRELRNVIERSMIFAKGSVITVADLPEFGTLDIAPMSPAVSKNGGFTIPKNLTLADAEKEYIRHSVTQCDNDIQRAAEVLGISRKNLWEKRKKYGLLD